MNLVKGNIHALTGRVVIFSTLDIARAIHQASPEQETIFAHYYSQSAEEIAEKAQKTLEFVKEHIEKERMRISQNYADNPPRKIVILPAITIKLDNIESLMDTEYDVVDSGMHPSKQQCYESICIDGRKYRLLLEEQINNMPLLHYSDIERKQTYSYVFANFITPMIAAAKGKQRAQFNELEFELFKFAERSEFETAAVDLSQAIMKDPDDVPYIYIQARLIHALNNGFSGQAQEYAGMIETMDKIKRKS